MRLKLVEWLRRYLPAELVAFVSGLIGGLGMHYLFGNPVLTALGGTWGENIGFYGEILFSDLRARKKRDEHITFVGSLKVLRNAIVEFGTAEYLDSFFIRPVAMYVSIQLTNNVWLGLILGKLIADVTFYIPTLAGYELRKKYLKD